MIFKRIIISLLCLFTLLAVMVLMNILYIPSTNAAAPNGIQTVTTLADSGAGSLRRAITNATAGDTIKFTVSGTITLANQLVINKNLTINGGGAITVSGNSATRIFKITNGHITFDSLTIADGRDQSQDCTLDNSSYSSCGAGIMIENDAVSVIIANSMVVGNVAGYGSGIFNAGELVVMNSIFSENSGVYGAGLLNNGTSVISNSTFSKNAAFNGGGIFATGNNHTVTISDSMFSGNSSTYGGGITNERNGFMLVSGSTIANNQGFMGGGVFNLNATTMITRSTVSGNSASNSGGGILNSGIATIQSSTIFNNATVDIGGGIHVTDLGGDAVPTYITVTNTIVSGNVISDTLTPDDLNMNLPFGTGSVTRTSGGYNLIGTMGISITEFVDGVNGDQIGVNDSKLGPLTDNGGPTLTHALGTDSPAFDAGGNCGTIDQRGIIRPSGGACDIGAYEMALTVFLPFVVK